MNFSVHLNDDLIERLNQTARQSGKARSALIREAIGEWLECRRTAKRPAEVINFRGISGIKRFEEDRSPAPSICG